MDRAVPFNEQGCGACRRWWLNPGPEVPDPRRKIGESNKAVIWQCQVCRCYWVHAASGYPEVESEESVKAQYSDLFHGAERADDGNPGIR